AGSAWERAFWALRVAGVGAFGVRREGRGASEDSVTTPSVVTRREEGALRGGPAAHPRPAGRGSRYSRARALTASGTPRFCRAGGTPFRGVQEPKIAASTWSIVLAGSACISRAASPATCGVAIDVPSISWYPPPGIAEIT